MSEPVTVIVPTLELPPLMPSTAQLTLGSGLPLLETPAVRAIADPVSTTPVPVAAAETVISLVTLTRAVADLEGSLWLVAEIEIVARVGKIAGAV